jgi:hypothetical protein
LTKFLQRRKKGGLINKLESKQLKVLRDRNEEQMLYLIQLWSDTFMMYEDRYPGFQQVYRTLRKEGVSFPSRDPNERMLMSSLGVDSPMFDYVEQISGRPTPQPLSEKDIVTREKTNIEKRKKKI